MSWTIEHKREYATPTQIELRLIWNKGAADEYTYTALVDKNTTITALDDLKLAAASARDAELASRGVVTKFLNGIKTFFS